MAARAALLPSSGAIGPRSPSSSTAGRSIRNIRTASSFRCSRPSSSGCAGRRRRSARSSRLACCCWSCRWRRAGSRDEWTWERSMRSSCWGRCSAPSCSSGGSTSAAALDLGADPVSRIHDSAAVRDRGGGGDAAAPIRDRCGDLPPADARLCRRRGGEHHPDRRCSARRHRRVQRARHADDAFRHRGRSCPHRERADRRPPDPGGEPPSPVAVVLEHAA